jgi:phosphohistidine phosphatase SixA
MHMPEAEDRHLQRLLHYGHLPRVGTVLDELSIRAVEAFVVRPVVQIELAAARRRRSLLQQPQPQPFVGK